MKSTLMLLLLLCGVCFVSNAQVILKGHVPDFSNRTLSLFEFEDFFTQSSVERSNQQIDENGEFIIPYPISHPTVIRMLLNKNYSDLYVQPGQTYELIFDQKGMIAEIKSNDNINVVLADFDRKAEANFYDKKKGRKDFIAAKRKEILNYPEFLKNVLQFRLATLEVRMYADASDTISLNLLEQNYFLSHPIDNTVPDYGRFVKAYFNGRANSTRLRHRPFNFSNLLKSYFSEADFVPIDSLQQLACLALLEHAYTSPSFKSREPINHLVDSIADVTANEKVKRAAINLKRKYNSIKQGEVIKDFSFMDVNGVEYSISSFRGKFVLLDFWFIGCSTCIENFPILKKLKEQNLDNFEIISLTPHDSRERVVTFLKKKPAYPWLFSSIEKGSELLSYFGVWAYPTYLLIDPEGKFVQLVNTATLENNIEEVATMIRK